MEKMESFAQEKQIECIPVFTMPTAQWANSGVERCYKCLFARFVALVRLTFKMIQILGLYLNMVA